MDNLPKISKEERAEMLAKAHEAKAAKKEWAEANLKQDWADKPHWQMLASKYGVRMPTWYIAGSESKYIKRLFKHVNMDVADYVEAMGCKTLKDMLSLDPHIPAYAQVGFALEWIDEVKNA